MTRVHLDPPGEPNLRRARPDDATFLGAMLGEAMAWRPGSPRPLASTVLASRYIVGWPRHGDAGLVAEAGEPVGAAWYRLLGRHDPGYGFVDDMTPELTVGVVPSWRSRGVGRRLLVALLDVARADGHAALSLSVEEDNVALELYESVGFERVEKSGNAWTMMCPLRLQGAE
jgi:ribosomal protein S18 acetylase RimI-like enzyme